MKQNLFQAIHLNTNIKLTLFKAIIRSIISYTYILKLQYI
jgi:hypothetical protein